jgi:hypothetical protein
VAISISKGQALDEISSEEEEDPSYEDSIAPKNKKQKTNTAKYAWSQLETTGEIFSKNNTIAEAGVQAASYVYFLLQARPDLISVVGIFYHPEKSEFALYFKDAWDLLHTPNLSVQSPEAKKLLVAWMRRLYNPERTPNIARVGGFPGTPTFTINAGFPNAFLDCKIAKVGSVSRRAAIFTTTVKGSLVVIKSQYFKVGRRFEESGILDIIHDGGDAEFPGVVRVLKGGSKELDSCGIIVQGNDKGEAADEGEDSYEGEAADEGWLDHRRGSGKVLQTQLVLRDVGTPFMNAETPLDALIAIYDLLEGNVHSLFLEQTLIPK